MRWVEVRQVEVRQVEVMQVEVTQVKMRWGGDEVGQVEVSYL